MGVLSKGLQSVPVTFREKIMTSRGVGDPGVVLPVWLPIDEASSLERQRSATILAAVSVLTKFQRPDGLWEHPGAALVGIPHELAERLERASKVKIISSEKLRERHVTAWSEHEARQQDLVAEARRLRDEAGTLERQARQLGCVQPAISW